MSVEENKKEETGPRRQQAASFLGYYGMEWTSKTRHGEGEASLVMNFAERPKATLCSSHRLKGRPGVDEKSQRELGRGGVGNPWTACHSPVLLRSVGHSPPQGKWSSSRVFHSRPSAKSDSCFFPCHILSSLSVVISLVIHVFI